MDISAITYSVFIPLLNSIHELSKSIGLQSFGWAIVLLTAIVKLLLTPLTYKQIKSTKQMQLVQPQLKKLQEEFKKKESQYKSNPEKLNSARMELQSKMMGLYKEHGVNPLGGCLPLLIQMPILLGLFWTFSGAPFQEKPMYVEVKVLNQAEAHKREIKPATKGEIFVDADGKRGRISLNSKGLALLEGEEFVLETKEIIGDADFKPEEVKWGFFGGKDTNDFVSLESLEEGKVKILTTKAGGSAKVQAVLPAALHDDSFFFIKDFGATGVMDRKTGKLNIDILILVVLFGISIWFSSKLNAPKLAPLKPGEEEDPQTAIQRSMATTMPLMMTVMMFLIPLPAGALLYMIVSGFIQAGQTYFAMKRYEKKFAVLKDSM